MVFSKLPASLQRSAPRLPAGPLKNGKTRLLQAFRGPVPLRKHGTTLTEFFHRGGSERQDLPLYPGKQAFFNIAPHDNRYAPSEPLSVAG